MPNQKRFSLHQSQEPSPHDHTKPETLGPLARDHQTPLGDTREAHDEIVPEDLPKGHPGRLAAERQAAEGDGTTRGDALIHRRWTLRLRRRGASTAAPAGRKTR